MAEGALHRFSVYEYNDYRSLLRGFLEAQAQRKSRMSLRSLNAKAGFKSPNHLQKVMNAEKNLSTESAQNLARACGFDAGSQKYFCKLVELSRCSTTGKKVEVLEELKRLYAKKTRQSIKDRDIHSYWTNFFILELATIKDFRLSVENIHARLHGHASKEEIASALEFLIARGYLRATETADIYLVAELDFQAINDGRKNFALQQCHLKYLDLAKHRIHDPLSQRVYQALTVAVPEGKVELVRQRICDFLDQLNEELSGSPDAQAVLQVQVQAFRV